MQKVLTILTCVIFLAINISTAQRSGNSDRGQSKAEMQEYLEENFELAFPQGITIGSGDLTLEFTSAEAVAEFFPCNGNKEQLEEAMVDPEGSMVKNKVAAKLLKLTITLGLDAAIEDFTSSDVPLGKGFVVSHGALEGKTVEEVLESANEFIAGDSEEFTARDFKQILSKISQELLSKRKRYLEVSEEYADIYEAEMEASDEENEGRKPRKGKR